ncbi:MAG: hypothetical protein NZL92_09715 [Gloeomargarita sp. SKYG116]|nr:hypothetical protein [Gloeomargarita sp. SKYG116]MDW8401959.1 hypothetical protein [Gloeomargarita sp. SKYGB_i_bin116]
MVFVPVVLGAVALGTALQGVAKGIEGWQKLEMAKELGQGAERRYRQKRQELAQCESEIRDLVLDHEFLRRRVMGETVGRFVQLAEQLRQKVSTRDMATLQAFNGASPAELRRYQDSVMEATEQLVKAGVALGSMASTAAAASGSAFALASLIGTASTGTAIGSLSGAAATDATLAWFGGGALAAGGGGMALGAAILGGITIGPALLVGGFMLAGQGEEAWTKAREYDAQVQVAIAKIDAYIQFLKTGVQPRLQEVMTAINQLNRSSQQALDELEAAIDRGFDLERDASVFQQAALLIKSLVELLRTPILDREIQMQAQRLMSSGS